MRPPEFTGGNTNESRFGVALLQGASMRPPEFTGGNALKDVDLDDAKTLQ